MKKGMGWPIGIVVILLATVASNVAVIVLTSDDPSFAVEPDYYRKAVAWDSTEARRDRSDALGWRASARVDTLANGASEITIALTDASGAAVRSASVRGALLHVARANDVQQVVFAATDDGRYVARAEMERAGVWELRLTADRNSEHFLQTLRLETGPSVAASGGP